MSRKITRIAVIGAAAAASTVTLMSSSAFAGAPIGSVTLGTQSGDQSTVFSMDPPAGASCSGAGTTGYRFHTYMLAANNDPSTLSYNASGPQGASGFAAPLVSGAGSAWVNKSPAASPLGLITDTSTLKMTSVAIGTNIANGVYKIGYICTLSGVIDAGKYWETQITVSNVVKDAVTPTNTTFNWVRGAVSNAPGLSASNPATNKTVNYTITAPVGADPAVTSYKLTATQGATTINKTVTSLTGSLTSADGIVNGTVVNISVKATNAVGDSAAATASATPTAASQNPVTSLAAAPGVESLNVTWTAPAGDTDPNPIANYTVAISPNTGGSSFVAGPYTVAFGTNLKLIAGLTAGTSYTVTVTPNHTGDFVGTAPAATASNTPLPSAYIVQDITVVRPVGAIVLTQRCGVNGYLPAIADDNVFGAVAEKAASYTESAVYGSGSRPYQYTGATLGSFAGGTAPTTPTLGGPADSNFSEYPYPVDANQVPDAVYPTHCGIDLGKAQLITSGPRAGQYFKAIGNLNEITLVNTRDNDSTTGWTLNGTASDFVNSADSAKKFSGNLLGWNPQHTADSGATLDNYNMTVTQGGNVAPAASASGLGLGAAKALSSAAAGSSLGISVENARLKLLVPVTAASGTYTATITFTTI